MHPLDSFLENRDGSGSLDCVRSHGWLARLLRLRRFHAYICNADSFKRGDEVQVFPATGDFPRGKAIVSSVRQSFFLLFWHKPVVKFATELPPGTRKGDLLVTNSR